MLYFLNRFFEPSTWAGIGVVATALATAFPDLAGLLHGVTWFAGALAVGIAEQSKSPSAL